jgi:hypothetical protein
MKNFESIGLQLCRLTLGLGLLIGLPAWAVSVPEGGVMIRQEVTAHQFDGYWDGSSVSDLGSDVSIYGTTFNGMWGFADRWQADLRLGVSSSSYQSDSRSGLSEIGLKVHRELIQAESEGELTLDFQLGARLPGTESGQGNRINALTDGVTRLEGGFSLGTAYDSWGWGTDISYAHRFGDPDDQLGLKGYVNFSASDRISAGPVLSILSTLGGLSVSEALSQGGLFSDLAEQHLGVGAFGNWRVSEAFSLGLNYVTKIVGKNTDRGTSLGLAGNFAF